MDGEVVFSIEDTLAAQSGTSMLRLLLWIAMCGVEVCLQIRYSLELLTTFRAHWRVTLGRVRL